ADPDLAGGILIRQPRGVRRRADEVEIPPAVVRCRERPAPGAVGVDGEGAVAVCRGLVVRDDQVDLDSGRETDRVDRERLSDQGGAGSEEAGARSISVTVAAAERVGRDRNGYEDDSGRQKEVPHRRSSSIRVPGAGCARTLLALPRSRAERESVPSPN